MYICVCVCVPMLYKYGRGQGDIHIILQIPMSNLHRVLVLLRGAAYARLSHGYAALGALERQCAHIQFQQPRTKLCLFNRLVKPTLLYRVETLEPRFDKADNWKDLEEPLF